MSPEAAIQIITQEELYMTAYNWFEDRDPNYDEVAIIKKDNRWVVYLSDGERRSVIRSSVRQYQKIEDALDVFIDLMRSGKQEINKRFARWESENETENDRLNYLKSKKEIIENDKTEWLVCKDRIYSVMG